VIIDSYTSIPCIRLFKSMQWAKYRQNRENRQYRTTDSRHVITQLRGMYGEIFESWIGPSSCESWAWVDFDIALGDLSSFIARNEILDELDIWTVSDVSGYGAIYPRRQFTVHKQTKNPMVNQVWKDVKEFGDFSSDTVSGEKRINTLSRSIVCLSF
jgi:hypothetical protein